MATVWTLWSPLASNGWDKVAGNGRKSRTSQICCDQRSEWITVHRSCQFALNGSTRSLSHLWRRRCLLVGSTTQTKLLRGKVSSIDPISRGLDNSLPGSESAPVRTKLSKVPMISPLSKFQRLVKPSILLYNALVPSGDTESETCANVWGVGNAAFGGCGWPTAADHCFTDPSAEIDIAVSLVVQATPQTASVWARGCR